MRTKLLVILAVLVAALATPVASAASSASSPATPRGHTVSYDRYSLLVDDERLILQTGEFHYFRLPSPDLWRDELEKIRAAGFNGVSLYFNWAYHSPSPGATPVSPRCWRSSSATWGTTTTGSPTTAGTSSRGG